MKNVEDKAIKSVSVPEGSTAVASDKACYKVKTLSFLSGMKWSEESIYRKRAHKE